MRLPELLCNIVTKELSMKRIALRVRFVLFGIVFCCIASPVQALEMCWVFGSGMVLQADRPVPVWGKARPGEQVVVRFAGQAASAKADSEGNWNLKLNHMAASPLGRDMRIETISAITLFTDVLVGDVWVCSGQSNMLTPDMQNATGAAEELKGPGNPLVRAFSTWPHIWAAQPDTNNFPGSPFPNRSNLTVAPNYYRWEPIGGRTAAVSYYFGKMLQQQTGRPIGLIVAAVGASSGESWLPWSALNAELEFSAYALQSRDYVENFERNEKQLAQEIEAWEKRRAAAQAKGEPFAEAKPAAGGRPQFWARWWAGTSYNAHIAPLRDLAVKGVIWYQGENNAAGADGRTQGGVIGTKDGYQRLMTLLIAAWRSQFQQPQMPFLLVQLSAFGEGLPDIKRPGGWPAIREAQAAVAKNVPHTGLAVSVDIGEKDVHPRNKRPVGERLAKLALRDLYRCDVAASGPEYASHTVENGKIRVRFDRLHGGLLAKGDTLSGFAIAGGDQAFVWAKAAIEGDTVLVWSEQVANPVAVRYIYHQYAEADLYNAAGLPAVPFRTDDWPLRCSE